MTVNPSAARSLTTAIDSWNHTTYAPLTVAERDGLKLRTMHVTLALVRILEDHLGSDQCEEAPHKFAVVWLANRLRENDNIECSEPVHQLFQDCIAGHRRLLNHCKSTRPVAEYVKIVGHEYLYDQ